MNKLFSEYFARKKNFITEIDTRLKIIIIISAILAILLSKSIYLPLGVKLLVIAGFLSMRIPIKIIILRLAAPLGIAIMTVLIKIFICRNDLPAAMQIFLKIIGSSSLILFLSMTTTVDNLLHASRRLKLPDVWVEICLVTYRYIFVILEDAIAVFDAQRVRLGYRDLSRAMRSAGSLVGTIIIRAYDQSLATYEAMMLRGYKAGRDYDKDN